MSADTTHLLSASWTDPAADGHTRRREFLEEAGRVLAGLRAASLSAMQIRPDDHVLDAGCGCGTAAVELAALVGPTGRVVAVDADPAMVAVAAVRTAGLPVDVRLGDLRALDLPDDSVDAARVERVLVHLTPPQDAQAVRELVRVTRPGGRVVVVEPDMRQISVDAGSAPAAVRAVALERIANPAAGIRARAALLDAGCLDVTVDVRPVVLTSLTDYRVLAPPDLIDSLVAAGAVDAALAAEAKADLAAREAAGRFLSVHVLYVVSGTVAGGAR